MFILTKNVNCKIQKKGFGNKCKSEFPFPSQIENQNERKTGTKTHLGIMGAKFRSPKSLVLYCRGVSGPRNPSLYIAEGFQGAFLQSNLSFHSRKNSYQIFYLN